MYSEACQHIEFEHGCQPQYTFFYIFLKHNTHTDTFKDHLGLRDRQGSAACINQQHGEIGCYHICHEAIIRIGIGKQDSNARQYSADIQGRPPGTLFTQRKHSMHLHAAFQIFRDKLFPLRADADESMPALLD